ncbi:MAG: hypothetical protein RBS43_02625 [Candidatus Cloacimonas sp.]|jgi:outer membrane lipopolysaccharide assembly protein LptE/RlpB|nr:hypothetical protein [Candidatus Cloacimonas sp.]
MIKKPLILALGLLLLLAFTACGTSVKDITKIVKASLQQNLTNDPQYSELNLKVTDLQVEKVDDINYKGIAQIEYRGELHPVNLIISIDGKQINWEPVSGAFKFIR